MAARALFAVLVILFVTQLSTGILFGGPVLVLSKDNFAQTITDNEFVMVMFYSPRCGYSRNLQPNFETAAAILNQEKSPIKLAMVDCLENVELRKTYQIKKYPTIKLFRHAVPLQYQGSLPTYDLAPHDIIEWGKENVASYKDAHSGGD